MTCRCGRPLIRLNDASDDYKCEGCGHFDERCTCAVWGV